MVRRMSKDNKTDDSPDQQEQDKGERIAKALARAGIASRRDVERMIEAGRISLDGKTLETPAVLIKSLEGIRVDGEAVERAAETKVWRMHKTKGTLTTSKDPEGRPTVFDRLPKHIGRVISVGRLDMNTEGLLLLTNDGALARWMELPANALVRRYRVRVYGRVEEKTLAKLSKGVTIDGVHYGEIDARLERLSKKAQKEQDASNRSSANTWLTVSIREGKNREVRRVMEYLGLTVNRLIRTHYGPFTLGTLPTAVVAPVNGQQLREILPEFFADAPQSVAAVKIERDTSRWAKAKKPTKNKPGAKRRRSPASDRDDARRPERPGKTDRQNRAGKSDRRGAMESAGDKRKPSGNRAFSGKSTTGKSTAGKSTTGKPTGRGRPQAENRKTGSKSFKARAPKK